MVGIILPPVPAFYHVPKTTRDLIDQSVGKVLDLFQIDHNVFERWGSSKLKSSSRRKD